jgi:NADH dehydrogenase
MRVAIFGGTGFVGSYIVDALHRDGHDACQLVRAGSEVKARHAGTSTIVSGELADKAAVSTSLQHCDAAIYCVGIRREQPAKGISFEYLQFQAAIDVVNAAKQAGVQRFLLMSANGVHRGGTPYQDSKFRAEEFVKKSGMEYTIFRPSVIFGDPRGRMEFATQLFADMIRLPFPAIDFRVGWLPTSASVELSPVYVADVADAFVAALGDGESAGRSCELGGPEVLAWNTILQRIAAAVQRRKLLIPVPIPLMKIAAAALDWLPAFPVTGDQLTMLAEGNTASVAALEALIGRDAAQFNNEKLAYLADSARRVGPGTAS